MKEYCALLKRLYALTRFGEKYDLSTPRRLEAQLGRPLSKYPSILIAGTNGKGSTSAFLETLLRARGLRTGLFTSPHLVSFTERIRIDGRPIDSEWLVDHGGPILDKAEALGASFFEAAWALAMMAFQWFSVDIAIWEVGLGGRLDATNVAEPIASAIVSIDLDHTHVLGDSLVDIAREKVAVFRDGQPALTGATGAGLMALRQVAPEHMTEIDVASDVPELRLPGIHQRRNASLAVAVARAAGFDVEPRHLAETHWPARGERIGHFLLDCAHNPAAVKALGEWVKSISTGEIDVIFGVMDGKEVRPMIRSIEEWASHVTVVTPSYPRRREARELVPFFSRLTPRITDNVSIALDQARPNVLSVVCGSGFLAGEARAHLCGIEYPECGIVTTAR